MRDRLIALLCNVKCEEEKCYGNCLYRVGQKCDKVTRLELCMVFAIADTLLAAGVIVPPSEVAEEIFAEIERRISSLEYRANTPRKTVKVDELRAQMDWMLKEVIPQTIAEVKKKYTEVQGDGT